MYLERTEEQRLITKSATRALARVDSLVEARAALDGGHVDRWSVAVDAGWCGLLADGDVDGVGLGVYEALLVLEACGGRLVDTGLLGHLPAAALIEVGAAQDTDLRRSLALGERRAALVDLELAPPGAALTLEGETLSGSVPLVLDAPRADVLVAVTAGRGFLVQAGGDGVVVSAQRSYDATRSLGTVAFQRAPARELTVDADLGRDLQRALLGAEAVGAAQACLSMSRDYALDRHAFGRPIGSYQALKHKMTEMLRKVENGRSLMVQAGRSWGSPRFTLMANAVRVAAGDALDFSAPENIFIHGGLGATWDHDAQLYYRRAEVSRRLAGGADAAARAVADALLAAM